MDADNLSQLVQDFYQVHKLSVPFINPDVCIFVSMKASFPIERG